MTLPNTTMSRPTLVFRARRFIPASFVDAMIITFVSLTISLVVFGLYVMFTKGIGIFDTFDYLFRGAFGKPSAVRNTLIHAAPLMLTALCVALPARVGMMIIGGEGCVLLGALIAALVAHAMPNTPPLIVQFCMIVGGMVVGGLWITIVGALRQYRGVNETISSLLLNYIARAILNHCVEGPMHDPNNLNVPSSWPLDPSVWIGKIPFTEVHWGLIFGIVFCIFAWVLMTQTTHGFATSIVGGNVRAAKVAGLSVAKYSLTACFLGGAAAGLAGTMEVAARDHAASDNLSQPAYGYAGILVAFVARQNPLAVIPVAILMGGVGNDYLKMKLHSDSCVQVFQGILFLVILGLDTWAGRLSQVRHVWFAKLLMRMFSSGKVKPVTTGAAHANT